MSFTLDITRFMNHANANMDKVVRKVVLQVGRSVIRKSPVDTGRFRGNWQLGTGTRPTGELDTTDPSGAVTVAAMVAAMPQDAAGKVYYITNNLPYAQALEDGHSRTQAPQGMVELTLIEFDGIVRDAAR